LSVEPYSIVEWLVSEGDYVETGESIVSLEAEKASFDLEAEVSGFIHIIVEAEDKAAIGSVIAAIYPTEEEYQKNKENYHKTVEKKQKAETPAQLNPQIEVKQENKKVPALPVARKLAREKNIDLSMIVGTGGNGIITKEDVINFSESKNKNVIDGISKKRIRKEIPLTNMKRAIAKNMVGSLNASAQLTVMGEFEMSNIIALKNELLRREETLGVHITYTDLFVFFIARVLNKHELFNSSLIQDKIQIWDDINIGVAVAVPGGLVVPNIKNADKMDIVTISKELKNLKEKALNKTLSEEEISDGTFTITNLGAFAKNSYRFETVIINQPEAAILGTGGISERVVVVDHEIVIRPIMTYYLTYDHQIVNGEDAVNFINCIQEEFSSEWKGII